MNYLEKKIRIDCSKEVVWNVLADIGNVSKYFKGVKSSSYIGDKRNGAGTARHCIIPGGYLKEKVIEWREGQGYTLETFESKGVPLKKNIIKFSLEDEEKHVIASQSMNYETSGGIFGFLMAPLMKYMLGKAIKDALHDLKTYCEAHKNTNG